MKTSKPILNQLPFLIAAIAVVIVLIWFASWQYVQQSLIQTGGEALSLGASEIASKFDRMISERSDDLRVMAVAFSNRIKDDPAFVQHYLDTVRETYETYPYHWVAVADMQGRLVGSTSADMPRGTNVSRTPWFQEIRAQAEAGSDATLSGGVDVFPTEEGAPDTIALSRAVYDSGGVFAGVVTSQIALSDLEAIAVETLPSLRHRNSILTDIEYQIIAEDGVAYIDSDLAHKGRSNFSTMKMRSLELAREGSAGYIEEMNLRRQIPVITGYSFTRKGPGQPDAFRWTVLVSIPKASLVQPLQTFYLKVGAVGLAIVVPIFCLLIWMQRRLQKEWQLAQAEGRRATAAEAQYHLLLQTTDQGIFGVDHNGRCTFINRSAAQMLGYAPCDLLGHPLHDLVHPGRDACGDRCMLVRALSDRNPTPLAEQVFRRKDGTLLEVECSAFPLMEASHTTDLLFTFMNITERKQQTKELLQYQGRLQSLATQLHKADELVRQRLATELHDNLAQTLALCRMKLVALSRAAMPPLAAAITPVTELLREALTVTRNLMSELRPPTLGHEGDFAAAVQWVTAKLQRHGLTIRMMDDGKRKPLAADVLRIAYQSLHELLFNVLKHAEVTEATVRMRRMGNHLVIQVKDRGVGFQMDGTQAPTKEGGFGLFNLCEQLRTIDGRIRVWSAPGRGSRVTMVFPLQTLSGATVQTGRQEDQNSAVAIPTGAEDRRTKIRILLVDDHQIMRQGLRSMLEGEPGFEVVAEAMDGEIAVELAASVHPEVILMDINMPKLNGVEATGRIKHQFPDIAVIGLSMHEDPMLEAQMYEVGASAYLSKGTAFNVVCDTIRLARSGDRTAQNHPVG